MIRLFHGTTSKRASKIVGNDIYDQKGFSVNSQAVVFFAEDVKTAEFFAIQRTSDESAAQHLAGNGHMAPKAFTVVEFSIPVDLAEVLHIGEEHRALIGEFSGMPFPDLADSSGHERFLVGAERVSLFNAKLASGEIKYRRLKINRKGAENEAAPF